MFAPLREFFLLRSAEEDARARSDEARSRIRELLRASERRVRAAESLHADHALAALILYRDALPFLAPVKAGKVEAQAEEAIAAVAAEVSNLTGKRKERLSRALAALSGDDASKVALDDRPLSELVGLRADVGELFEWMDGRNAARTVTQIRIIRWLRQVGAALALVLVGRYGVMALLASPNRALHKPVVTSSHYPDTPDPGGLTDGDRTGLGAHTNLEPTPMITVDLGVTYKVDRVKIYHRTDCCPDEILPLIVEVGDEGDPAPFVAERTTHFDVWEVDVGGHPASTVRVKSSRSPGYIALAELEVFGRR